MEKGIKFNTDSIMTKIRLLISSPDKRTKCNQALAEVIDPWVPYDTGRLSKDLTITSSGVKYNAPYASEQYYGTDIHHKTEHHPLATAQWDKVALQTQRDELNARVKDILRGK